jgi:plastocyanin
MQRFLLVGVVAGAVLLPSEWTWAVSLKPKSDNRPTVAVRTFAFRPARLDVKAETAVVWTNEDEIEHTVTAGTPEATDSLFHLVLSQKGANAAFTFEKPGTYAYHCARHPFMRGEIHVTLKGVHR